MLLKFNKTKTKTEDIVLGLCIGKEQQCLGILNFTTSMSKHAVFCIFYVACVSNKCSEKDKEENKIFKPHTLLNN